MIYFACTLLSLKNIRRAGVIPYTYKDGSIYFLLARDAASKQLSDFGGGVKKSETPLDAAAREFQEESCNIFDYRSYQINSFTNCISLVHHDMVMIFHPISPEYLVTANFLFNEARKRAYERKNQELCGIKWVHEGLMAVLIYDQKNPSMWSKISKFIGQSVSEDQFPELVKTIRSLIRKVEV